VTEQETMLYNFFRQKDFLPVGRESYPVFQNYQHDSILMDLCATLITTWGGPLDSVYKNIHGHLCVVWFCHESLFHGGVPMYFTVLKPRETSAAPLKAVIDTLFSLSTEAGLPFLSIESIEEQFLNGYQAIEGYDIKTSYSDDHSEYAYRIEDLLNLSGGENFYKRKRVKKCFESQNISFRPITKDTVNICLEIMQEWCQSQDCGYCGSFAGCEKKAVEILIQIFDEQFYAGLFLYQEEKPIGYCICEKTNAKVAFLNSGKSTIQDFFVYLIYIMFKEHLTGFQYMNIGEDMGNSGLRQFKKHLSAHELWKKYLCTFSRPGRRA
jgi:hypothetical protein